MSVILDVNKRAAQPYLIYCLYICSLMLSFRSARSDSRNDLAGNLLRACWTPRP